MSKRSPFPNRSLPQAGESLHRLLLDRIYDKFFVWLLASITFAIVGVLELAVRLAHIPWSPWCWLIGSVILGCFAAWRWFQIRPHLDQLALGVRGEREVGRMLEDLRLLDYRVFHDIPGENFNIDHVLVGPGGVFAVETKTWSKPAGRRAEVDYDGTRITIDGRSPDRDPIAQASAVADFLRDLLKRMTNRGFPVRPVVLFPTWWVHERPGARVWVLNADRLGAYLRDEPEKLSREDIALLADRLTLHLSKR